MRLLIYFFVGFLVDILGTLDTQCVIRQKPFMSAIYSFLITISSVFIISRIVLSEEFIDLVLSYALGSAIGSALTIIYRKNRDRYQKIIPRDYGG